MNSTTYTAEASEIKLTFIKTLFSENTFFLVELGALLRMTNVHL